MALWKDGVLWTDSMLKPQPLPDEVSVRGISGDISIISQALNNMPPDGCPLAELGLAAQFAEVQTVDFGRDIKVAPPSTSATLRRQGSGSSSCSGSGSGGGLSSKRLASSGPASTSSAPAKKKRAFTSPYHEFCQERRPFVPAGLNNAEREKVLGMAWKAKLADEKRARISSEQQRFRATLTPTLPWGAHGSTRVAHGQTLRVHCQPPPAPCQPLLEPCLPLLPPMSLQTLPQPAAPPPGPLLDPHLPPFPPMSLQTLSPPAAPPPAVAVPPKPLRRAPELRYLPLELLTAAASHRTGIEHYLDHQQQLAEVMEDQITGEEAIEIAISLGMSRPGGDDNFSYL